MFSFISKCIFIVYSSIPTVNYVYWFPKITVTCLNSQIYKIVSWFLSKRKGLGGYMDMCVCVIYFHAFVCGVSSCIYI
jgi:hypothetical protein